MPSASIPPRALTAAVFLCIASGACQRSPSPDATVEPGPAAPQVSGEADTPKVVAAPVPDAAPPLLMPWLLTELGRAKISALMHEPGQVLTRVAADAAVLTTGITGCRLERLGLPKALSLPDGERLAALYKLVVEGEVGTRSEPLRAYLNGQPLGRLHDLGHESVVLVAASGFADGAVIGIGFGRIGIDLSLSLPPLSEPESP